MPSDGILLDGLLLILFRGRGDVVFRHSGFAVCPHLWVLQSANPVMIQRHDIWRVPHLARVWSWQHGRGEDENRF